MARKIRKLKRHSVKLGWKELWRLWILLLAWLWKGLCLIRYLNPVHYLLQRRRQAMVLDRDGTILYKPGLLEIFSTEALRQRRLLEWVQELLPNFQVNNLSSAWSDGVVLCALMEALCPGACPRYDLLKPRNKISNCRLSLKLSHKHLNISQTLLTPEDMALAIPGSDSELKMRQFLTVVRYYSSQHSKIRLPTDHLRTPQHKNPIANLENSATHRQVDPCLAKGTGLVTGVMGKMCKFNVFVNAPDKLDLHIEIKGPNGELCSEKIMSLEESSHKHETRKAHMLPVSRGSRNSIWDISSRSVRFWKQQNGGIPIIRERSMEIDDTNGKVEKIPFDYQCVNEGHFVITYIPRSSGLHIVHVKWHSHDIKGSPYNVKIVNSIEELNINSKGVKVLQKRTSLDYKNERMKYYAQESIDSVNSEKSESKCEETEPGTDDKRRNLQAYFGAAVRISKQATITRRRVLRRVITKAGQEIVIHEAPPSVSTINQMPPENNTPYEPPNREGSPAPKKSNGKAFDFGDDSDNSSRPETPLKATEKKAEKIVNDMVDTIITGVFQTIEQTGNGCANGDDHTKESEPVPEPKVKDSLQPPFFDANFSGSPFLNNESLIRPVAIKARSETSDFNSPEVEDEAVLVVTDKRILSTTSTAMNPRLNFDVQLIVPRNDNNSNGNPFARPRSPFDKGKQDDSESCTSTDSLTSGQSSHVAKPGALHKYPPSSASPTPSCNKPEGLFQPDIYIEDNDQATSNEKVLKEIHQQESTSDSSDAKPESTGLTLHKEQRGRKSSDNMFRFRRECVKKTLSDPLCRKRRGRAQVGVKRANTTPTSSVNVLARQYAIEDYEPTRCSNPRAIEVPYLLKPDNSAEVHIQTSGGDFNERPFAKTNNTMERPMQRKQKFLQSKRLSMSEPTLARNSTSVEEFSKETGFSKEEELVQLYKRRLTVGSNDLSHELKDFDERRRQIVNLHKLKSLSRDDKDRDAEQPVPLDFNQLEISLMRFSPKASPVDSSLVSSTPCSTKSSRRGSLVRQDVISLKKVSEEDSQETDKSDLMNYGDKENQHPDDEAKGHGDCRGTLSQDTRIYHSLTMQKSKVDQFTQVSYEEIKQETGWNRPNTYIRHRRTPLKIAENYQVNHGPPLIADGILAERALNQQSVESYGLKQQAGGGTLNQEAGESALNPQAGDSTLNQQSGENNVVNQQVGGGNVRVYFGSAFSSQSEKVQPLHKKEIKPRHLQPIRQSTVETVDSGIADDSSTQHNTPPGTSSAKPISQVHVLPTRAAAKYISGHRVATRRQHRKQVSIDSWILKELSSITSQEEKDKVPSASNKNVTASHWSKPISDIRRVRVWLPTKDDSAGMRRPRKRSIVGCHRKTVTFSRRVMLYRRSSSKSSKRSSRESRESKDSFQSPKTCFQSPKTSFQFRENISNEIEPCPSNYDETNEEISDIASFLSQNSKSRQKKIMDVENWITQTSRNSLVIANDNYTNENWLNNVSKEQVQTSGVENKALAHNLKNNQLVLKGTRTDSSPSCRNYDDSSCTDFGVSSDKRENLLSHLNMFSNIVSAPSSGTSQDLSTYTSKPITGHSTSVCPGDDQELAILLSAALDEDLSVPRRYSFDNKSPELDHLDSVAGIACSSDEFAPRSDRCVAYGVGLTCGQVAIKNNFQVQTDNAGNGALSVGITGPRPHAVSETNLTYTGDNLYEVIYEVTHPGYYRVNIKWSERDIPGSPFICRVTY